MRVPTIALVLLTTAAVAHAQSTSDQPTSEDIEPRLIGTPGTTMIGLAGYVDRLSSSERAFSTNYTAQIDISRFIARAFVVRGGLSGSGSFGGEDADELASGSGVPALHTFVGLFYYFTPQSMLSLYTGGEYWAQLWSNGSHRPLQPPWGRVEVCLLKGRARASAGPRGAATRLRAGVNPLCDAIRSSTGR